MRRFKKFLFLLIFALVLFGVLFGLLVAWSFSKVSTREPKAFGITYVARFAEKFGMDRKEVFSKILDELGARNIRLPLYWDEAEPEDNHYRFEETDWQLEEAKRRGAKVILAVGRKLPRWPECHQPAWVLEAGKREFEKKKLLEFLEVVVNRYQDHPALFAWQVENEPFLPFGEDCPLFGGEFLDEEIRLVRTIDPSRPVIVTDSGELSIWMRAAKRADIFGTTMYRTVWNENIGYFTYPLPPGFFRVKRALTELFAGEKPMFVSELQAEPWGPKQLYETPIEEALRHFDIRTFREHIEYAKRSGLDEFYLWGVEWWRYLEINGRPEIWNEAKNLF